MSIRKLLIAVVLCLASVTPFVSVSSADAVTKQSTYLYAAATRANTAVYVHGLVKVGPNQTRNGNRLVYLQRNLGGQWQTMLSRRTLTDGTVTVGFIQKSDYAYRWVALEVGYAAGGTSATVHAPGLPFGDGTYRVNVQIAPGLYYTPGLPGGCYWARLKNFSGDPDAIIANDFFFGPTQVQVFSTDVGFQVTSTCIWRKIG